MSTIASSSLASSDGARSDGVRHASILECIGRTPVVRISDKTTIGSFGVPHGVSVYVKLESENPGGSIKDRLAYGVIEWAERHGHLQPGQVRAATM
jgi:cysteine synthase